MSVHCVHLILHHSVRFLEIWLLAYKNNKIFKIFISLRCIIIMTAFYLFYFWWHNLMDIDIFKPLFLTLYGHIKFSSASKYIKTFSNQIWKYSCIFVSYFIIANEEAKFVICTLNRLQKSLMLEKVDPWV